MVLDENTAKIYNGLDCMEKRIWADLKLTRRELNLRRRLVEGCREDSSISNEEYRKRIDDFSRAVHKYHLVYSIRETLEELRSKEYEFMNV